MAYKRRWVAKNWTVGALLMWFICLDGVLIEAYAFVCGYNHNSSPHIPSRQVTSKRITDTRPKKKKQKTKGKKEKKKMGQHRFLLTFERSTHSPAVIVTQQRITKVKKKNQRGAGVVGDDKEENPIIDERNGMFCSLFRRVLSLFSIAFIYSLFILWLRSTTVLLLLNVLPMGIDVNWKGQRARVGKWRAEGPEVFGLCHRPRSCTRGQRRRKKAMALDYRQKPRNFKVRNCHVNTLASWLGDREFVWGV